MDFARPGFCRRGESHPRAAIIDCTARCSGCDDSLGLVGQPNVIRAAIRSRSVSTDDKSITLIDRDFGEETAQACVNAWLHQLGAKGNRRASRCTFASSRAMGWVSASKRGSMFRQHSFRETANSRTFIDLPVSPTATSFSRARNCGFSYAQFLRSFLAFADQFLFDLSL
jgi:hypothetical protein